MMIMLSTKNKNAFLTPRTIFAVVVFIGIVLLIIFSESIGGFLARVTTIFSVAKTDVYQALPKNVLASRLLDAEETLDRIRYQAVLYSFEASEYDALRDSLGLPENEVFVRGTVISRPPRTHYDTFLISYDAKQKLEAGDLAFAEGIYVGTVTESKNGLATVSLLSSPGKTFDVEAGSPSAIAVARGLGGGALIFDVPKEVDLKEGDIVSTAHNTPQAIAIVHSIVSVPELTTSRVYASSPVNMNDVRILEFKKPLP